MWYVVLWEVLWPGGDEGGDGRGGEGKKVFICYVDMLCGYDSYRLVFLSFLLPFFPESYIPTYPPTYLPYLPN